MNNELKPILARVDHTLLSQTATWDQIRAICDDGVKYGCASVCIPASYVKQAVEYVAGQIAVCTVIGFPNGYDTTASKCFQATDAVQNGASEIDMVINIGWVKDGLYDQVLDEIRAVKAHCQGKLLKVIIETCLLTDAEKIEMCRVVSESGAEYIKTSTGFGGGGATREDVALFKANVAPPCEDQGRRRHRQPGRRPGLHRPGGRPSGHQPHRQGREGPGTGINTIKHNTRRNSAMSTPHNSAAPGAFAKTVLMPGDPLRSQFIAETFLENPVLVNNVRGVQGYTGAYKGVPVSVMASGMGMPSIGIYSHELYTQYGVENIIRVGSAGALRADLELGSVVAGQGACTNSSFADQYELGVHYAPIADFDLLMAAVESARELGVKMPVGNLYSSDTFYDAAGRNDRMKKMGVMAVEMEAAALYCTAAYLGKRALAICSISDNLVLGTELTPEERQTTFTNMMKIGLEAAVKMARQD